MLGMGSIARNEVTEDSKRIIDICRDLVKRSGITNAEFYKKSGMRNNYWHVRLRYEAPLTTSDVEHIASTFGLTSLDILLYLVVFRFGLTECLEIEKRWYFNAFAIL